MKRLLLAAAVLCVTAFVTYHESPKVSPQAPQTVMMNGTMPPQARALLFVGDTLTASQRHKLDSIFSAAVCWRFIRPPQPYAATSPCPDSVEAATLVRYAPMVVATPTGMRGMMVVGDHLKLRAVMIHGHLYVGPEMIPLSQPKTTPGA